MLVQHADEPFLRLLVDVLPDDFEQDAEPRQRAVVAADGSFDHAGQLLLRLAGHPLHDGLPQIKQDPHVANASLYSPLLNHYAPPDGKSSARRAPEAAVV